MYTPRTSVEAIPNASINHLALQNRNFGYMYALCASYSALWLRQFSVYSLELLSSRIPVGKRKGFFRLFKAKIPSGNSHRCVSRDTCTACTDSCARALIYHQLFLNMDIY
jgi:hypothetical protein